MGAEDVEAHIAFQRHVADVLRENGEYVDAQALTPTRTWVRNRRPGRRAGHDRRPAP